MAKPKAALPDGGGVAPASAATAPRTEGRAQRPVHTIRYGNVRAAVWVNDGGPRGTFFSVTAARTWRDEAGRWHDSPSFNFNDLPQLAKAAADAHSWVAAHAQDRVPADPAGGE